MDHLHAVLLGILQGLTEFLPISSTAHLILAERFLNLDPRKFGLTFDIAVHFGTAIAVILFYFSLWISLFRKTHRNLLYAIIIGTIPAAIIGILIEDFIETTFRSPSIIVFGLVAGSIVFFLAERFSKRNRAEREITLLDGFLIGVAQALALIPGISRSGITISAGLFRNLKREEATTFAFLLSLPIILGATLKRLFDTPLGEVTLNGRIFLIGFLSALLSGYLVIAFLLRFLKKHPITVFAYYRLALATLILIVLSQS